MCGYPVALQLADVTPIAAPVPRAPWAEGRPLYRSDLIVRADSPWATLEDTFGGRAGWTVEHSHSGFNAFRHHLLQYRTATRPTLYREMVPNLVTARAILDAVRDGRIDVGPLDAYWHMLIARHQPELTRGVRVLAVDRDRHAAGLRGQRHDAGRDDRGAAAGVRGCRTAGMVQATRR